MIHAYLYSSGFQINLTVSLSLLSDDPPSRFLEKSVLPLDAAPIHVKTTGGGTYVYIRVQI